MAAVDNTSALEPPHNEAGPSSTLALKNSTGHGFSNVLVTTESSAADAPPLPAQGQHSLRQKAEHVWNGLPTAAKATLILAIIGSFLLIAYSIFAVSLRSVDEEAHIATVIIVISIFMLYAVFDAVIYENTLQLIIAIILSKILCLDNELCPEILCGSCLYSYRRCLLWKSIYLPFSNQRLSALSIFLLQHP